MMVFHRTAGMYKFGIGLWTGAGIYSLINLLINIKVKTVTSQTCSNKLRVRAIQIGIPLMIPKEFEQCIGCTDYEGNYECEKFHPYQFTFPVRTGVYAAPPIQ